MESELKDVVLELLRELTRQVQSMDEAQLAQVMAGSAKLEVRVVPSKRSATKPSRLGENDLRELGELLKSSRTREEGNVLLDQKISLREDMAKLAKFLDLPVQKSDSVEQIRARIIESTIGFRIRSAAIQGVTSGRSDKTD